MARRAALLSSRGRTRADEGSRGAGGRSSLDREPAATSSGIVYDAQLVIIRHGKTEFNKLGLFTGWDDAPLAPEGRDEAIAAGQLLKAHGLTFDVVSDKCVTSRGTRRFSNGVRSKVDLSSTSRSREYIHPFHLLC